ncbi:BZ3500_MvSof-1268-A1-R1_Chr2-1g04452 [Microbotryum saponariae]|uniref:BZ3500_MvSof-1268-A1-R1_Chr2-1g04452 protein n=1 Tax=Microbotryum saponariae TaxID=289078 RepID=A0A2X0K6G7_9BASI|nr:BZ3500_MvSof-1268-A1-R1_Chr2-1g04452 [Microbotryum saponariae]SCZ91748.1 BZ3501_MvSof-1269-A2-R1_Chr2-1g04108 [Microbotryum saponariae]
MQFFGVQHLEGFDLDLGRFPHLFDRVAHDGNRCPRLGQPLHVGELEVVFVVLVVLILLLVADAVVGGMIVVVGLCSAILDRLSMMSSVSWGFPSGKAEKVAGAA